MPRCIAEFLHSIPGSFCPGAGADDAEHRQFQHDGNHQQHQRGDKACAAAQHCLCKAGDDVAHRRAGRRRNGVRQLETWFTWLQCAPAEAMMVVSEMGEQWSPHTAPDRQAAMDTTSISPSGKA